MWILGAAFFILLWEAAKASLRHGRAGRQASRKASAAKAQTPGQRRVAGARSDIGWWAAEILRLFPVHRAGWSNGWRAHHTRLAQQRAQRDEARTSHLEARASIAEGHHEHQQRQQAAQARIDQAQAPPPPDELGQRRATKTNYPLPAGGVQPDPSTNGGPVATHTDGSYTETVTTARQQATLADYTGADVAAQRKEAERIYEEMQAAGVDAASLAAQADLVARLHAAEDALKGVTEQGEAVGAGVTQRHGGMKEAVDDAPVGPAELDWYKD